MQGSSTQRPPRRLQASTRLAIGCLLWPAATAAAQIAPSAPATTELEAVQVQTQRYDARRDDLASRIVVDHETLRRHGDTDLLEALKRLPGLSVSSGAPGRPGAVSLRGLGSGYTQILLDGQRAPAGFSLDSLATDQIERIEILRAPTVDHGTGAIAGTLNIVTRATAPKDSQRLTLSWAGSQSRSTPTASWRQTHQGARVDHALTATATGRAFLVEEHGSEQAWDADGQPLLLRNSQLRATGRRDNVSLSPSMTLNATADDTVSLQALLDASDFRRDMVIDWDTQRGPALRTPHYRQRTRLRLDQGQASAEWTRQLQRGGTLTVRGAVDGNRENYRFREQGQAQDGQDNLIDHTDARLHVLGSSSRAQWTLPARGRHTLQVGAEGSLDDRRESRLQQLQGFDGAAGSTSDLSFNARLQRVAVYAQDEFALGEHSAFYLGGRWERLQTTSEGRDFAPVRNRASVFTPVLQGLWKRAKGKDQLRVSLSRTFRAPELRLLVPRPYTSTNNRALNPDEIGNPALRPELAWGLDTAWELHGREGTQGSIGGYLRRIDSPIRTVTLLRDGRWVATPVNGSRAIAWGIELDGQMPLARVLPDAPEIELRGNATWNQSRVRGVPGPDNRIQDQVPFTASAAMDYRITPRWSSGLAFTYRSGGRIRYSLGEIDIAAYRRELEAWVQYSTHGRGKLRLTGSTLLGRDSESGQWRFGDGGTQVVRSARQSVPSVRLQWELPL
ncbi:TonB-dependent receptor [Stenotrophomonas sp. SAU14A_NAIMI4_5]|uniref:TonB-dependent receptor plug domain-containing protein n=1 Tax=Stenotrophomonas sp. SAU14A_NAIMI4_5 TaxID=2072413 RepID=UPI000D53D7A0|nr:TonB-dependent receptor [Stenotrophomonas sp. SAU14A_NAIMI4_5]AWH49788.1 TonB-dependent receptor [Stenotrophomonas sp. SAU14A_NAIMI4_5]